MKIAVVHDWLVDWAGSERVLEQMLACFPSADLFSLVDFLGAEQRAKLLGKRASTTFLGRMPFSRTQLQLYLPLMPYAIEQLDLSNYDLILSSSHAVAKGVIVGPDQLHVSYVHSPMRYAWDLQPDYLRGTSPWTPKGLGLRWLLHYLRMWDSRTANGVDAFIANSQFIARRVRKAYRRDAHVIHPPVELERFSMHEAKEDFYVCVSRLMPYKRVDLIIDAFSQLPTKRLLVIGDGPERRRLAKLAPSNVELLGAQSDATLRDVLQRAKALVFAAKEDFGISIVEAQACGTPVIAFAAGGALETVVGLGAPEPTGIFFREQTAASIVSAVEEFERNRDRIHPPACRRNAERFAPERFRSAFTSFVDQVLADQSSARDASI